MAGILLTPATITTLTEECKVLLSGLSICICDEILCPTDDSGNNFTTKFCNLDNKPAPKVHQVNALGAKTLLFETTDYKKGS